MVAPRKQRTTGSTRTVHQHPSFLPPASRGGVQGDWRARPSPVTPPDGEASRQAKILESCRSGVRRLTTEKGARRRADRNYEKVLAAMRVR
jgi:hypothetical protein